MIDRGHELSPMRQAGLLRLCRSSLDYEPRPLPAAELAIMRRIDALHLDYPFTDSRMPRDLLRSEDIVIGRELAATIMRRMGIKRCIAGRTRPRRRQDARSIGSCCVAWRLSDRTRFGQWTSPTFRWHAASSALVPWWTSSAGGFWPGGCRSPRRSISASRRSRRRWFGMARPRFSTTIRVASSPVLLSPDCCWRTRSPLAWMAAAPGATNCASSD